ncbi:hypothetical protein COY25_00875 [Candidatus Uhrbacteria bacterium CG_4_10_14_0_2_um_filter_41_7]|nr:MAG: hypothetical protein COY25_00875 [Candidatus Uhrbacteria bacterium CG_4_10_14_0_2_um_filter_41_7]
MYNINIMCFSAPVSFISSAGLLGTGAITLRNSAKDKRMIAAIPIMFGIQQFLEGSQWLFLNAGEVNACFGYGFLFFAFLVWPTYIPLAVYSVETNKNSKKILKGLALLGFLTTLGGILSLATSQLFIEAIEHHVVYGAITDLRTTGVLIYVTAVVGSMFVASDKRIKFFGLLILISAGVAWVFFNYASYSVWCLFSAVLSGLIYIYLKK